MKISLEEYCTSLNKLLKDQINKGAPKGSKKRVGHTWSFTWKRVREIIKSL